MARTKKQEDQLKKTMMTADDLGNEKIKPKATRKYLDVKEIWENSGKPNVLMIMTGRGTGKTTSAARWMAEYCYTNHRRFVLLSRNAFQQVKRQNWFHNAVVSGFTPYDVRCEGNKFYIDDQLIGFNWSLHAYNDYRSTEYPEIDFMILEEYIEMEPINYWNDNGISEAQFLSDLASTVFRDRSDGTILIFGNNLNEESKYNPYHEAFGIDFDEQEIEINHMYDYSHDNIKVKFYYGGMGREGEFSDVQGWAAYMPYNEVALSGEFAPSPVILSNFLKDHSISLNDFKPTGAGLSLCTGGLIEYITYYECSNEEYHVVSRSAVSHVDYEPYRIRNKSQANRFQINHETHLLYESAKDKTAIRRALDPNTIGIQENQRNLNNYNSLMETDTGCLLNDVKIQTYRDFDRWTLLNIRKCSDWQEFREKVQKELGGINPDWIKFSFNRYEDLLLTNLPESVKILLPQNNRLSL